MSETSKPQEQLAGKNSNVFELLANCVKSLKEAGQHEVADKLHKHVIFECGSYNEALETILKHIEETGISRRQLCLDE